MENYMRKSGKLYFAKRIFALLLAMVILVFSSFFASATSIEQDTYNNFYYKQIGSQKKLVEDKPVYKIHSVIDGRTLNIDSFCDIKDIYYSENGRIYILDSGNKRLVVLNNDFSLNFIINNFVYNGEKQELNAAEGIYVFGKKIFIADTENRRILVCDDAGVVSDIIEAPTSDLIPDEFDFYPVSMLYDKSGYFYILTRGSYYGALMYDTNMKFIGFFGANSVSVTLLDTISSLFSSIFETNAKLASKAKKLPYQFYDFDTDKQGFIYTVSPSKTGQLKKLNLKGNNILKYKVGQTVNSAESFDFGALSTYTDTSGHEREQVFSSISVDELGFIYALDSAYGKIYIYDTDCNNIAVFGCGVGEGKQKGTYVAPSCIETVENYLLVSDSEKNSVTVMTRTYYGDLIMKADYLTVNGKFEQAEQMWQEVLKNNADRQIAYKGLALVNLNKENYSKSMEYAKKGIDVETYSAAYKLVMSEFLNHNLWWILIIVVALIIAVSVLLVRYKPDDEPKKSNAFKDILGMCLHPIDFSSKIHSGKSGSLVIATIILVVLYISKIAIQTWSGFMYAVLGTDFNALYTLIGSVGVVLLAIICHWGVSTIFSGKANMKHIYLLVCYSLIPIIVYRFIFVGLSYVAVSASFIYVLKAFAYIYTAAILMAALINVHEYSLLKFAGVVIATAFGMLVTAFLIFVVLILGQNFLSFAVNIISEFIYK